MPDADRPLDALLIPGRYNGPPASGNGGWVAGMLARRLGTAAADVSLRAPPPLDVPLAVQRASDDAATLQLRDGETLLAEARPIDAALDGLAVPTPPSLQAAQAAGVAGRLRARRHLDTPYARCFGCGILRDDGLRIAPGLVGDDGIVATDWVPADTLDDGTGAVSQEVAWAALDCPAGIAWGMRLRDAPPMMTARIAACVDARIAIGAPHIVIGWPIARDGRKLHAGTAVLDAHGRVCARSRQLWLLPKGWDEARA